MSGKLSDRLRLESALDLQRRLPPNMIEAHVAKMIDIVSSIVIGLFFYFSILGSGPLRRSFGEN